MSGVEKDITYLLYFYSATAQTLAIVLGIGVISLTFYASWMSGQKPQSPVIIPAFEFGCGVVITSITIIVCLFMLSVIDSPKMAHLNEIMYTVVLGCTVVSLIIFSYLALYAVRALRSVSTVVSDSE